MSVIPKPLFFFHPSTALPLFQVCPSVFEVPVSYHRRGGSRLAPMSNNDEELLQYAIHQSLLESRTSPGQVRTIVTQLFCKYLNIHRSVLIILHMLSFVCVIVGGGG